MAATLTSTKSKPKTKREKRVFKDSTEVAHVWAQQQQSYGCNPTRNIYFESTTIFSYGSHFPMARFAGRGVVLVTNRSYSSTTSGQQRDVENALRGLPVEKIYIRDVEHYASAKDNLRLLWESLTQSAVAHVKARQQDFRGTMRDQIENLAKFAKFAKIGRTKQLAALLADSKTNPHFWAPLAKCSAIAAKQIDTDKVERQKKCDERREAKYARERAQRERQQELDDAIRPVALAAQLANLESFTLPAEILAEFADCFSEAQKTKPIPVDQYLRNAMYTARRNRAGEMSEVFKPMATEAWRQGLDAIQLSAELVERFANCLTFEEKSTGVKLSEYLGGWDSPTMLRISGSDIETSRGARVPVRAAKIAWPSLVSHNVPPDRIGMYEATEFADGILTIGCHRIPVAEMNRIATELGMVGEIVA